MIQTEYGFDNKQSGFVVSLFYWTYAAGQIPSGVVIDRFGPHHFHSASIVLRSLALADRVSAIAVWCVSGRLLSRIDESDAGSVSSEQPDNGSRLGGHNVWQSREGHFLNPAHRTANYEAMIVSPDVVSHTDPKPLSVR